MNLSTIKNALMTTAVVLLTIYAVRRVKAGDDLVKKAISG